MKCGRNLEREIDCFNNLVLAAGEEELRGIVFAGCTVDVFFCVFFARRFRSFTMRAAVGVWSYMFFAKSLMHHTLGGHVTQILFFHW